MNVIHSLSDLAVAVDQLGELADEDRRVLVEAVRVDDERPDWGRDWSNYLSSIDVPQTVLAGAVVREVKS